MSARPRIDRRRCCAAIAAAWLPLAGAAAVPREVLAELPGAALRGRGRLRFLGLRIYEARLWAPAPVTPDNWALTPLALEIEYERSLAGRAIAERSLEEMRRQGEIEHAQGERWLAAMSAIFPDVSAGDRVTGISQPVTTARYFWNGDFRGEVQEAGFARRFFGIWLASATSQPRLRAALLGSGHEAR